MEITINNLKKNSISISPVFEHLIISNSNLLNLFPNEPDKEILTSVNLIGLLEIDNFEFTKDYSKHLNQLKNIFSTINEFDDIEKTFTPLFNAENFAILKTRIESIVEFIFANGESKGIELIKRGIEFLEKNSNSQEWRIYYSDIWQISYSLILSKDLTLSQVDLLNSLGIVNVQTPEQIQAHSNRISMFNEIPEAFYTNLKEKLDDLIATYSIENITETISFLNSLDNSKLKALWLFVSIVEAPIFQEEIESEYLPQLKPLLDKVLRFSDILNQYGEFESIQINLFQTSNFALNYALFDDIKIDIYNLIIQINQDNNVSPIDKNELTQFLKELSKLLSLFLREKNYPINLVGDEQYLSAYDFINYFQDSLPVLFDIFDYDLSHLTTYFADSSIDKLKELIHRKTNSWQKKLSNIASKPINNLFEIRYSKLKQVFNMELQPAQSGDHQNAVKNLFNVYESVPNRTAVKNNYQYSLNNIELLTKDLETIAKSVGINTNEKNIDNEIYSSIAIYLGLLGFSPNSRTFDKTHLSNYLKGYYNFDALDNWGVVEDLKGFIV